MTTTERQPERPLFHGWVTLLILFALVMPYLVYVLTDSEPYPSLIFPRGGAIVVTHDGEATYTSTVFVGFDEVGREVEVSAADLVDPLPSHYAGALAAAGFGSKTGDISIPVRRTGWSLHIPRRTPSPAELAESRTWLSERLDSLGLDPHRLVVRTVVVTADADSGNEVRREPAHETTIGL